MKDSNMDILIADNKKAVITAAGKCNPSFDIELGNPLAFDIDAVVVQLIQRA